MYFSDFSLRDVDFLRSLYLSETKMEPSRFNIDFKLLGFSIFDTNWNVLLFPLFFFNILGGPFAGNWCLYGFSW